MEAALKGAREVGFTVLSISLSLVAVFIPLLLMGGIVGRLFREFAVVLSTAILVSLVVSLTTTPMMCSRLLRHREPEEHGRNLPRERGRLQRCCSAYARCLRVVLRHPATTDDAGGDRGSELLSCSRWCPRDFSRSRTTAP